MTNQRLNLSLGNKFHQHPFSRHNIILKNISK
jgi:hypothetical protein